MAKCTLFLQELQWEKIYNFQQLFNSIHFESIARRKTVTRNYNNHINSLCRAQ